MVRGRGGWGADFRPSLGRREGVFPLRLHERQRSGRLHASGRVDHGWRMGGDEAWAEFLIGIGGRCFKEGRLFMVRFSF